MGVIADLMVKVGADTAAFTTGLTKVNTGLEETEAKGSKFGGVMAGAGLLAAGAVTGIVAFGIAAVEKTEQAGQAAFEMGEKFGLSGEQASSFMTVGKQLGLSNEQIGKGFQFLSKNAEAMALTLQTGHQVAAGTLQPYKDLGINVLDAGGKVKSANELMLEAADAFKGMKDGPEKAALAMKLFGKSGTDLLPMLNEGRAGIQGLIDSGKAQGDVMTNDQVAAAHKLFLEHKQLDTAIAGVTTQIGTALMPIMVSLIPVVIGFAGHVGQIHEVIQKLQPWLPFIAVGLGAVAGVIVAAVLPAFLSWTAVTWGHVYASIALAAANVAALWPIMLIVGAIALLVVAVILIVQHWDFLKAKTLEVWSTIKSHVLGIVSWFEGVPGRIAAAAVGMWDGLWNTFKGVLNQIIGAWNKLHFTIGGGTFAGVSIPSMTLGLPQLPTFHTGGMVPGSGNVLAMLEGGEGVTSRADMVRHAAPPPRQLAPHVIVQVDGRQLALALAPYLVDEARIRTGLKV